MVKRQRAFRCLVLALIVLGVVGGFGGGAEAADDTSSGSTSVPQFNATLPAAYQAASITANFGSCVAPMLQAQTNALATALGTANPTVAGNGGSCGGSDEAPDVNMSCEGFSQSFYDSQIASLKAVKATIACKKGRFDALKSNVACLQGQANALTQQIQSLQQVLQQNLSKQAQDVAKIDSVVKDRQDQFADVNRRLGDSEKGGGLLGAQKMLNETLAGVRQEIQDLDSKINGKAPANPATGDPGSLYQMYQNLDNFATDRKMALTNECFTAQAASGAKCQVNGGSCTPEQYVLDRFWQNQIRVSPTTGRVRPASEITQADRDKADAAKAQLQTALDAIFQEASTFENVVNPSDPNAALNAAKQVRNSFTLQDLLAKVNGLSSFDGNGLKISEYVSQTVSQCYKKAQTTVDSEKNRVGTPYYTQLSAIKKAESDMKAEIDKNLLQNLTQVYTQSWAALTLNHIPLDLRDCSAANLKNEFKCVTDLQTNLEGLLQGNTENSQVMTTFQASDPALNITFKCSGINGCITSYQQVQENLNTEVKRLGAFRTDYVTKANQMADQFMTQMKGALSTQSQVLADRLKGLNLELTTNGLPPISIAGLKPEQMEKDETTGLYKMPEDILAVIGGGLTPPMLDVDGESFTDGLNSVADASNMLQDKESRANQMLSQMDGLDKTCKQQIAEDLLQTLSDPLGQLEGSCTSNTVFCEQEKTNGSLNQLSDTLGNIINSDVFSGVSMANASLPTAISCLNAGSAGDDDDVSADAMKERQDAVDKATKALSAYGSCYGTTDPVTHQQLDSSNNSACLQDRDSAKQALSDAKTALSDAQKLQRQLTNEANQCRSVANQAKRNADRIMDRLDSMSVGGAQ